MSMRKLFLTPYRALRRPPKSALVYLVAYTLLGGAFALLGFHGGPPGTASRVLLIASGAFGILGGAVGAVSQFRGLWFLERGALFAIWGSLICRFFLLVRTDPGASVSTIGEIVLVLAVGFWLIPRFQSVSGADQDPTK